jgi:hypothetical protein
VVELMAHHGHKFLTPARHFLLTVSSSPPYTPSLRSTTA